MITFALLTALTLVAVNATPLALESRDRVTMVWDRDGEKWTIFAPDWPTCANDHRLTDAILIPSHPSNVTVRPDCDDVIDIICRAADREARRPKESQNMTSVSYTIRS